MNFHFTATTCEHVMKPHLLQHLIVPVLGRPSSSPPQPSCALPLLSGDAPSPRCVSSPPARAGAARAPAASSSHAHAVVAADRNTGGELKEKRAQLDR